MIELERAEVAPAGIAFIPKMKECQERTTRELSEIEARMTVLGQALGLQFDLLGNKPIEGVPEPALGEIVLLASNSSWRLGEINTALVRIIETLGA